jgi:hypothetical protein
MEHDGANDSAWDESTRSNEAESEEPRTHGGVVDRHDFGSGLTAAQHHAVLALLTEASIAASARRAGVGERTLHRWLRDEVFMAEYRRARREAFSQAIGLTQRASASAVATLLKIMHDATAAASARVSAASQILRFARESIEVDDLAERVAALESEGSAGAEESGAAA